MDAHTEESSWRTQQEACRPQAREREASFEANTSGALVLDLWLVDCEKNKCALLTLLNVVVVALADGYINYLL